MDTPALDTLMLSRMQFAANITFHILFPAINIALCWVLLFFKLRYDRTKDGKWMEAYRLWVKIFALCFALGVVSGVTMSFQFGTNWPGYMEKVGNIAGPLLAYEVLTAFFLEATFLGIMLFGFRRVSNRVHTLATFLVAAGTSLSAFWILALNSWMQTPAGYEIRADGKLYAADWLAILFNPSMPYRIGHMLLASGLTTAFLLAGLSAYRWLRDDRRPSVLAAMRTGVFLAAALIPAQILLGDAHGLNTLKHQPAKIAAIEGIWETEKNVPLLLFALPDEAGKTNRFSLGLPGISSLILTHELQGEIKGLNEFKDHPAVLPVFWAFRVMVGTGLLMLLVSWTAAWRLWRQGAPGLWVARALVGMTFAGWVATVAGWYTTEMGRQPWLVYGILRTKDAVAQIVAPMVAGTLVMYLALYSLLIASFVSVIFHLARKDAVAKQELPEEGTSAAAVAEAAD